MTPEPGDEPSLPCVKNSSMQQHTKRFQRGTDERYQAQKLFEKK